MAQRSVLGGFAVKGLYEGRGDVCEQGGSNWAGGAPLLREFLQARGGKACLACPALPCLGKLEAGRGAGVRLSLI